MRKWMLTLLLTLPLAAEPAPLDSAGIYDKLWVQTSADYRAHCLQTYGWATRTLRELAAQNPQRDSQGRVVQRTLVRVGQQFQWVERPLAVIMDLDETVIDMSAYRAFLHRMKRDFEAETWDRLLVYMADRPEVCRSIPGAVDFIGEAEKLGFTVFFVSNRTEEYRSQTLKVLETIGVGQKDIDSRLLLDPGKLEDHRLSREYLAGLGLEDTSALGQAMLVGQGRKERRRFQIRQNFSPVVFVGDDLGDFFAFVKDPQATPEQVLAARYRAVQEQRERWGREFFFLPNPMYGNWSPGASLPSSQAEKLLHDDGFVDYYKSR